MPPLVMFQSCFLSLAFNSLWLTFGVWRLMSASISGWLLCILSTYFLPMVIWYTLVGGLEHFWFSIIYGIILPIDEYFSDGLNPPTSTSDNYDFVRQITMISQAALGRWSEMQGDSGMAFSQWIGNKYFNTPAVFRNEQTTTNYKLYYI